MIAIPSLPDVITSSVYARDKGANGIQVSQRPMFGTGNKMLIIKVLAAGINPVDYKLPSINPFMQGKGVGIDVCGEIAYAPVGSTFQAGQTVFGYSASGGLSEYCECDPGKVALKPESLSAVQCAMMPVAGITSLQALRDKGNVQPGDSVLIIGASGGCGVMGVSIAKALGATVTGVCSGKNREFVQSLGADSVHCYDGADGKLPSSTQFDCIFDTVTSSDDFNYEPLGRPLLKSQVSGGKRSRMYVAINGAVGDWIRLLLGQALWLGDGLQRRGYKLLLTNQNSVDLGALGDICTKHSLPFHLDEFSANERPLLTSQLNVDTAFTRLKSRRTKGKIILAASEDVWSQHFKTCSN